MPNSWYKYHRFVALLSVLILTGCAHCFAQVWQWSVPVAGVDNNAQAFLWIPPGCKQVKGLVLAQHNMEEISILENPLFRKEMASLGFAEIWVSPSPNVLKFFDFSKGAGAITLNYIDSLAKISGYSELSYVPVVPLGHSAAASFPYYFAALYPDRTLAAVSTSGQWPYFRNPVIATDIWGQRNVDYIPCLETMGEYEAAETWSTEGLKERLEHPLIPLSMLAVPGEGHFASSDGKSAFIAFYIRKAVQYRYPAKYENGKTPVLKPVDPTKTGWLADKWRKDLSPTAKAAPIGQYEGDKKEAFWYFDKETARAVEKYGKKFRGMKPQLVGYKQNGKMALQQNTHLQVGLKFIPENDGVTFYLKGAFYDTVPVGSPRLPIWTGLPAGTPISHSKNVEAITIERICGHFRKVSDTIFVMALNREINLKAPKFTFIFAVKHPGNNKYKSAVQQGEMVLPGALKEGTDQIITFAPIPDQKVGVKELPLLATSDAGVPVYFYVLSGPAEVERNVLKFTPIPPKAKYPVKVTVVAWQYGHSFEPKLKSAIPVVRNFYLTK
ncbi:MAG TPA: hypothetical protein VFP20_04650 [Bacteroidales bacterium]|nr:hypothetical protein [Bacteroidales bacterium]